VAVLPRIAAVVEPGLLLDPGFTRKALPALASALLLGVVFLLGLGGARPRLLVVGGAGVTAMLLGYGAWLANAWTDLSRPHRP
jgi:hypothetical protein